MSAKHTPFRVSTDRCSRDGRVLLRLEASCASAAEAADLAAKAQAAPELLALLKRFARGEESEAHGAICKTDPCLRCEAVNVVAKVVRP